MRLLPLLGIIVLTALPARGADPLACEQCRTVLQDGVFNTRTLARTNSSADAFRSWQCTTDFHTHADAHAFGVDFGVEVYGVPLKVGGTYTDSERDTWKQSHCSDTERHSSSFSSLTTAVKEASPEILAAWSHCIDTTCGSMRESIECRTETTDRGILFKARWLRSTGDDRAPRILSFRALDARCDKPPAKNTRLREDYTSTVCKPSAPEDVVFIFETTRGSCTPVQSGFRQSTEIEGKRVLNRDTYIKADRITLKDAVVVTNGNELTLEAKVLRLEGLPTITAFEAQGERKLGQDGRNAGKVQLLVDRIEGTSLKIVNDGEPGAKGETGAAGQNGQDGQQGQQRSWDPLHGCGPGSNGTPGGNGGRGQDGFRGGRGGKGGDVVVRTSSPLTAGGVCRIQAHANGGEPGPGGEAGHGGGPGAGGQGAPGTSLCGGTGPGPGGAPGANGNPGPAGTRGDCGAIKPSLGSCDVTDHVKCQ